LKRWFDFRAQSKGAEIVIYDEIGAFGIPAKSFLEELKALGPVAELTVRSTARAALCLMASPSTTRSSATMLWVDPRLRHRGARAVRPRQPGRPRCRVRCQGDAYRAGAERAARGLHRRG
jgi:hypothetical protein